MTFLFWIRIYLFSRRMTMKKVLAVFLISFMLFCYVSCNDVPKVSEDDTPVSIESDNESQGQVELCERIAKSLSVNEIDKASNLSAQLVKPLTSEEKVIVMNALVQRINNRMWTFSKSFGSKQGLISDEVLAEIEKYQLQKNEKVLFSIELP